MPLATDKALAKLRQKIVDEHDLLLVILFGEDSLPTATVARLKRNGYTWPVHFTSGPRSSFEFGMLAAKFQHEGRSVPLTYEAFRKAKAANPVPLTASERVAMDSITRDMISRIKGLGDTVNSTTAEIIAEADRDLRRKLDHDVQRVLRESVEHRRAVKEVASKLRQATKDYAVDFTRIAATELNNAYQEGKLYQIKKMNKGRDPFVYKQPRPDACEECKEAYLEHASEKPRVFRLSVLLANGTNVGKKRARRKPTIGSHHPWCRCVLHELPAGFNLDDEGNMIWVGL